MKDIEAGKGETLRVKKRQAFKPITTRTLYPGIHYAELVVNGVSFEKQSFELLA